MRVITAHLSLRTFPLYRISRGTVEDDVTMVAALVVGMPSACIASEHRNSLMLDRSTFRPSAVREYGVVPAPLN